MFNSALVHLTSPHDGEHSVTETELWQIKHHFFLWAVLSVPLAFELVPERAVVETATIVADFHPADIITTVVLTAVDVLTIDFASLVEHNSSISAVSSLIVLEIESDGLFAPSFVGAWVGKPLNDAHLALAAIADLLSWRARVVDNIAEPVA